MSKPNPEHQINQITVQKKKEKKERHLKNMKHDEEGRRERGESTFERKTMIWVMTKSGVEEKKKP